MDFYKLNQVITLTAAAIQLCQRSAVVPWLEHIGTNIFAIWYAAINLVDLFVCLFLYTF